MNTQTLRIRDESPAGKLLGELLLNMQSPVKAVTIREIIRARVYHEVDRYHAEKPEYFKGLVQPGDSEVALNGFKILKKRKVDPEEQYRVACEAYRGNGFFILIGERQAGELDEPVIIAEDMSVTFVKLTPLVGG
jgi:hypothetical protein